jgi:putative MATE family efflux protein
VHGVWRLAWPSITTFALQSAVGLVDLLFVSRLGADPVAGVGIGSQLHMAVLSSLLAITTGTIALVARATGAGRRREAAQILRESLLLAAALGAALTAVAPFTDRIVAAFGVDAPVVAIGGSYLRILMLGSVPLAVGVTFASALRGAGDVRTPLAIGIAMNVSNVVGDYALIFGNLGAPALGADGSAWASALSFLLGACAYGALWGRDRLLLERVPRERDEPWLDPARSRRITRIGIPSALEQLSFNLGLFLFLGVFSSYGTVAVSAYIIGVRIISFSLIPGMGFQIAAATLVGQHLGANRPDAAARSGWRATAGAVVAMSALGVAIALNARAIAGWFGAAGEPTIELAVVFLTIVCAAQPLMALEFGVGGALRGAGDTRFPLFAVLMGLFVCRLGGALVVIHVFGGPISAVWACLLLDYAVKGALLAGRFRLGRWRTLRI